MNEFFERYARQSHESGAAKHFSQLITQTASAFLVFTAWLGALWPALRRRRQCAAASPGTLCLGSASRALLETCAARARNDRAARWYSSYGTVPLSNKPLTLVMSLAIFAANLKAAGQL
jgi:hypothetical protein